MMLGDLGELSELAKMKYTNGYKNRDIILNNNFKILFENYLQTKNDTIRYLDYSAEITIHARNNKIFLPNQWFCISAFFIDFVKELVKYKTALEEIENNGVVGLVGKSFWKKIEGLKNSKPDSLDSSLRNAIETHFVDHPQSVDYMIRFLTDYDWWKGNKTIDRNDFYVSPILNLSGVVNVTQ